jgi:glutamate dehydrogenase (NADP+)
MQQNASRDTWTFEQTEARLETVIRKVHDRCRATADEYVGAPDDYASGANIAGFLRVADAMTAQGRHLDHRGTTHWCQLGRPR